MPETGNLDASLVLRQLPCRGADFLTSQCSHAVQHMLLGKAASDMILNKSNIKKQNKTKQNKTKQNKTKHIKKRKEKKRKENKRKEKKRKEKKRKEKKRKEKKRKEKNRTEQNRTEQKRREGTTPFGVNLMRHPVLYRAAQVTSQQYSLGPAG